MFLVTLLTYVIVLKCGCCQKWQERKLSLRIPQGLVEGLTLYTESSKLVNSFLGIPYAAAPIGNNRFKPPQKHAGWNETFKAIGYGPRCAQLTRKGEVVGNEDCLYLNIWSPSVSGNFANIPVLMFFEGLDFYRNTELPISGQDLAVEGVVVVIANYRLNIFGYFCLGTEEARGNLGLLDQYFAILWVKDNIKHFGGDPDKITLFGHSSGAVSVAFHLISPRTAGLFQRAIISSGSAVSAWQTQNDPIEASKEILRLLTCNSFDYLRCLRSKTTEHVLRALQEYSQLSDFLFLPVVDTFLAENNRYLPNEPAKAFREATFFQVPILTGISKPITHPQLYEWVDFASQGYQQLQYYVERSKIPEILRLYKFTKGPNYDQVFDLVNWKYGSTSQDDVRLLFDQIRNLEFESKIEAPHFLQLSYLNSYVQPIFVYSINDVGPSLNTTDQLAASDLILLFGPSLLKHTGRRRFNSMEARFSAQLKKIWIDFIYVGNPTPNNNRMKQWRKYTPVDQYIENFDFNSSIDNSGEVKRRSLAIAFWNQLLPKMASHVPAPNVIPKELQKSPDPGASLRHALFTLVGLVISLLILLIVCIVLLKKKSMERDNEFHLSY
ncbi:carboxylesterase 5A-like [Cylas formicarius]|uniref:carboxylesterase 5A-like n=1 Tax=Cylas formicarius TaxID=197179 RepID=UPI002958565E|nr:carboxylesterase 5A-like [Cylas formicarius]